MFAIDSENPQVSVLEFAHEIERPHETPDEVEPYGMAALLATLLYMRSVSRFQASVSEYSFSTMRRYGGSEMKPR